MARSTTDPSGDGQSIALASLERAGMNAGAYQHLRRIIGQSTAPNKEQILEFLDMNEDPRMGRQLPRAVRGVLRRSDPSLMQTLQVVVDRDPDAEIDQRFLSPSLVERIRQYDPLSPFRGMFQQDGEPSEPSSTDPALASVGMNTAAYGLLRETLDGTQSTNRAAADLNTRLANPAYSRIPGRNPFRSDVTRFFEDPALEIERDAYFTALEANPDARFQPRDEPLRTAVHRRAVVRAAERAGLREDEWRNLDHAILQEPALNENYARALTDARNTGEYAALSATLADISSGDTAASRRLLARMDGRADAPPRSRMSRIAPYVAAVALLGLASALSHWPVPGNALRYRPAATTISAMGTDEDASGSVDAQHEDQVPDEGAYVVDGPSNLSPGFMQRRDPFRPLVPPLDEHAAAASAVSADASSDQSAGAGSRDPGYVASQPAAQHPAQAPPDAPAASLEHVVKNTPCQPCLEQKVPYIPQLKVTNDNHVELLGIRSRDCDTPEGRYVLRKKGDAVDVPIVYTVGTTPLTVDFVRPLKIPDGYRLEVSGPMARFFQDGRFVVPSGAVNDNGDVGDNTIFIYHDANGNGTYDKGERICQSTRWLGGVTPGAPAVQAPPVRSAPQPAAPRVDAPQSPILAPQPLRPDVPTPDQQFEPVCDMPQIELELPPVDYVPAIPATPERARPAKPETVPEIPDRITTKSGGFSLTSVPTLVSEPVPGAKVLGVSSPSMGPGVYYNIESRTENSTFNFGLEGAYLRNGGSDEFHLPSIDTGVVAAHAKGSIDPSIFSLGWGLGTQCGQILSGQDTSQDSQCSISGKLTGGFNFGDDRKGHFALRGGVGGTSNGGFASQDNSSAFTVYEIEYERQRLTGDNPRRFSVGAEYLDFDDGALRDDQISLKPHWQRGKWDVSVEVSNYGLNDAYLAPGVDLGRQTEFQINIGRVFGSHGKNDKHSDAPAPQQEAPRSYTPPVTADNRAAAGAYAVRQTDSAAGGFTNLQLIANDPAHRPFQIIGVDRYDIGHPESFDAIAVRMAPGDAFCGTVAERLRNDPIASDIQMPCPAAVMEQAAQYLALARH